MNMEPMFIELTRYPGGKKIVVNMALVGWYTESNEEGTTLYFELGAKIPVKESMEDISRKVARDIFLRNEIVTLKERLRR